MYQIFIRFNNNYDSYNNYNNGSFYNDSLRDNCLEQEKTKCCFSLNKEKK